MSDNFTVAEFGILMLLKSSEGLFYVTPDGNNLYLLVGEGGDQALLNIERLDGPSYSTMSEDELNAVIVDYVVNHLE